MRSVDGKLGIRGVAQEPAEPGSRSSGVIDEARRIMTICNACRYCEGLCAVFPAMERRIAFEASDLRYLATLCHDCRSCLYACQYAPPHEFEVNVPRVFAELRRETYERHTKPPALGRVYRRNGLVVALVAGFTTVLVPALALVLRDPGVLWSAHTGPGAFYDVIPLGLMIGPASIVSLAALLALLAAALSFWREIAPSGVGAAAVWRGGADALKLTYLGGGGDGCTYPDEVHSFGRRWLHHAVFWGFVLDLSATTVAAFYEHVLHLKAPYPVLSVPVLLGTAGGVLLVLGTGGLLRLKMYSDGAPSDTASTGMDVAFLLLLLAASVTGLALLALRETVLMPGLLLLHLGVVAGFFVTVPFGKLVHAVYRTLALVRYAAEGDEEG